MLFEIRIRRTKDMNSDLTRLPLLFTPKWQSFSNFDIIIDLNFEDPY